MALYDLHGWVRRHPAGHFVAVVASVPAERPHHVAIDRVERTLASEQDALDMVSTLLEGLRQQLCDRGDEIRACIVGHEPPDVAG